MLSRSDLYTDGLPAEEPFGPFIDFVLEHAGHRILDVGCGTGTYVARLRELGRDVEGVELDERYVAAAAERGLPVHQGNGDRLPFDDGAFQTALLFEVIEHVSDPTALIAEALRVAGTVLVTTPNIEDFPVLERYGFTYHHMITLDHLHFFVADDLEKIAEQIGARVTVERREPLDLLAAAFGKGLGGRAVAAALRRSARPWRPHNRLYAVYRRD